MILYLMEGDQEPRRGIVERVDWPDDAVFTIRELPSGALLPNCTEVRVLGLDPVDHSRIEQSRLTFVGGLPTPRIGDGSRWLREQIARER